MAEPAPAPAPLIDHRGVDWSKVSCVTYVVQQHFAYEYPGPIRNLRQQLIVVPRPVHGDQQRRVYQLDVDGPLARRSEQTDAFGNHVISLRLARVERLVEFRITLEIERHVADPPPLELSAAVARYLNHTALTAPDAALREASARLGLSDDATAEEKAAIITRWVYSVMRYQADCTTVETTAAQAFALRAGVCQDYAHIMLALCRLNGVPARYVSGHLLGEGGTHAWVEALIGAPGDGQTLVAKAFDPTHGRAAGLNYLTVATGRDYADVPPTSGAFEAPYGGVLRASKRADVTALRYRAAS